MKKRPILFNAPMVRALLDGSKTQTRRVVKLGNSLGRWDADGYSSVTPDTIVKVPWTAQNIQQVIPCKFGQPGDRLWVREAWTTHACFDKVPPRDLTTRSIHYLADGEIETGKYRPPMFMPRWASRITLEITGVRVERLQDISEADAIAEGIDSEKSNLTLSSIGMNDIVGPVAEYSVLWESINGPGSWDANPWVWVVEFRRTEK